MAQYGVPIPDLDAVTTPLNRSSDLFVLAQSGIAKRMTIAQFIADGIATTGANTFTGAQTLNGSPVGLTVLNQTVLTGFVTMTAGLTRNNNVTAAGTNRATATALTTHINVVRSVPVGTGVALGTINQLVFNRGTEVLSVYPPSGVAIDSYGADAAVYLDPDTSAQFTWVSSTEILSR